MVFQIVGFLILLLFYGCYFGKVLRQKSQGIQTDQLGWDKTGFPRFIELSLKVVSVLLVLVEVDCILRNDTHSPLWLRCVGAVLGIAGVVVFAAAIREMGNNWRAGVSKAEDLELVTSGIYHVSRNPAFLGFDLLYLGILLLFFSWKLYGLTLLAILLLHLQIVNVEEDHLLETFGEDYLRYRSQVNRYLGRKK